MHSNSCSAPNRPPDHAICDLHPPCRNHDACRVQHCARNIPQGRRAADVSGENIQSARADLDLLSARHLIDSHGIRHLVVVDNVGKTIGIVSDTDFRLFLGSNVFRNLQTLDTVMDRHMPHLAPEALLEEAICRMLEQETDYVIVTRNGIPLVIITERDMPRLLHDFPNPHAITVAEAMTHPVQSIA